MRKILIFVAIMTFVSMGAFAQTEKGKFIFSGASELSFSSMTSQMEYDGKDIGDDHKVTSFNIKPAVGYFVMDNLSLGLNFDYESEKYENDKNKTFMVGPMARYYFGSSKFKPYVHADLMFGSMKNEGENYEINYNASAWDLGAGVAIFLNDYISIDLGLGYASFTAVNDDDDKAKLKTKGVAFNGGFSVFF